MINLTVVIDNEEAVKKLRELQKVAKQTTSSVVTDADRMDMAMARIARTLGQIGAGASLVGLVKQVGDVRSEFQKLEISFETMLQSEAKAASLMAQLTQTAATTPFGLQEVAGGAKQLLAYGTAAEKVNDTLIRLGDIAAGLSIPLGDLVYLYGTTQTQGRLFTQDLRQFQGRGIPLAEELAKQFGVTSAEVGKLVTAGKVGFAEVEKAIISMTSEGGKFGGLMAEQSKTIGGLKSNLEDAFDTMFNDIGKKTEGAFTGVLKASIELVENYEKVIDILVPLVATYGSYRAALIVVAAAQKAHNAVLAEAAIQQTLCAAAGHKLSQAQAMSLARTVLLQKGWKALTASIKASSVAMLASPVTWITAALAGLSYVIYRVVTAETAQEKAQRKANEALEQYGTKQEELKSKAEELHSIMKDEATTAYQQEKAYQQLIAAYPELLDKYDKEKILLMDIVALRKELAGITDTRDRAFIEAERQKALEDYNFYTSGTGGREIKNKQGQTIGFEDAKVDRKRADEALAKAEYLKARLEEMDRIKAESENRNDKNSKKLLTEEDQKKLAKLRADGAMKIAQAEVAAMSEGSAKVLAQIELDYQKREAEIVKWEDEIKKLRGGSLTEEEAATASTMRRQNDRSRTDSRMSALFTATPSHSDLVAELQAEEEAWNEYLIKYGNFQEKVLGTTAKYAQLIENAKTAGEQASLEAERDAALAELEAEASVIVQTVSQMTTETIDTHLSAIQGLLAEAEDKLAYESGGMSQQEVGQYKKEIAVLKAQISALQSEKATRSKEDNGDDAYEKWAKRAKVINDLAKQFKSLGKEIGGAAGEAISTSGEVATGVVSIIDGIKQFSTESINAIQTASTGAAKAVATVEAASVILAVVSAVIQVTKSLVSLFGKGADYSDYEALKAKYEDLNEVWDQLIEKKTEYISMSYGAEVDKVGQEAIDIIQKQIDGYRQLGKERLRAGASAGSHSIGVRQLDRMNRSDKQAVRDVAAEMGFDANEILSGRMTKLFNLSADQLAALREGASTFWAKLDDDAREYLDSIIEAEERIGEIHQAMQEQWTQISFDELKSSFIDSLMDMDKSAKDFANDFSEYLMRAMMTTKIGELYEGKLQEWYDAFAESNRDGNISDNEIAKLREEWNAIVHGAVDLRDQLAEVTGYGTTADAQSATARGFQAMSQETGSELNGRFTDIQGKVTDIRAQGAEELILTRQITDQVSLVRSMMERGIYYAQDTRDVLINVSHNVAEIRDFAESLPRIYDAVTKTNKILDTKL